MADYIKREDALQAQNKSMNLGECRKRLERIPAADVREAVHARWKVTVKFDDCYYADCPACRTTQVFYGNKELTNYCPNCGAMMDGKG